MTSNEGVLRLYVFNCQISSFGDDEFFYICERTSYSGKVAVAKCLAFYILVPTHETIKCYTENIQYSFIVLQFRFLNWTKKPLIICIMLISMMVTNCVL